MAIDEEECRCSASCGFVVVGVFEDAAEFGEGLDFRFGEDVAGAEFLEGGEALKKIHDVEAGGPILEFRDGEVIVVAHVVEVVAAL